MILIAASPEPPPGDAAVSLWEERAYGGMSRRTPLAICIAVKLALLGVPPLFGAAHDFL